MNPVIVRIYTNSEGDEYFEVFSEYEEVGELVDEFQEVAEEYGYDFAQFCEDKDVQYRVFSEDYYIEF